MVIFFKDVNKTKITEVRFTRKYGNTLPKAFMYNALKHY